MSIDENRQIIIHCPTTTFIETDGPHAGSLHIMLYPQYPEEQHLASKAIIGFAAAHGTVVHTKKSGSMYARSDDYSFSITMLPILDSNKEE